MAPKSIALPLIETALTAEGTFRRIKQSNASAAVYREGPNHYLIEAGAAFVAWKKSEVWHPASSGVILASTALAVSVPSPAGQIQIFPLRAALGFRLTASIAACYCLQCESPGKPPLCTICGGVVACE
jgi:hypothetical protein